MALGTLDIMRIECVSPGIRIVPDVGRSSRVEANEKNAPVRSNDERPGTVSWSI
jgi:hypothetical protein